MVRIEKGKGDKTIDEIATEFRDRLYAKYLAEQHSKEIPKTVFSRILVQKENPRRNDKQRKFLEKLAENSFVLLFQLLSVKPDGFDAQNKKILKIAEDLEIRVTKSWRKSISKIFGYDAFDKTIGRKWFLETLDIKVCPSCNFQFFPELSSRSSKGDSFYLMDIDHFLRQSEHPWFSMSFYNLIPTCLICNRALKGAEKTSFESHLHPYKDSFHENAQFLLAKDIRLFPQDAESLEILLKAIDDIERTEKTIKLFRLDELYKYFSFEARQVLEDFRHFNPITSLKPRPPIEVGAGANPIPLKISDSDLANIRKDNRIPTHPKDIRNIPLGKLKFDLLQQLTSNLPKPAEESSNDQHVEEQ